MNLSPLILDLLRSRKKYSSIIDNIENADAPNIPFIFEATFAYTLEKHGISPDYEVNVTPLNNFKIDFVYGDVDGSKLCFELLSPNMGDNLTQQCTPEETGIKGISKWEVILEGNHPNQFLRPEAQTIRMQEKILEKVDKFPDPSDDIFSTIVVNCNNFHFGHFDGEDCRMVMFGRTQNQFFQEFWEGKPIRGLLNEANDRQGAEEFRKRVTSVIFILEVSPETSLNILDKAFIVLNILRSKKHLESFWEKLKGSEVFRNLKYVPPPK